MIESKNLFLQVSFHGGGCCGILHIHSFPQNLDMFLPARDFTTFNTAEIKEELEDEGCGEVYGNIRNLYVSLPAQSAEARFRDIVYHLSKPNHPWQRVGVLLEVAMKGAQRALWKDVLDDLGFNEVTSCYNENTGNKIYVFHLPVDIPPTE